MIAHRHSWELVHGPIPEGQIVRHLCGLTLCVNPKHLAIGTHQDNADDRERDGNTMRGMKHWKRKLTLKQVNIIRTSPEKGRVLAKRFGVAETTVSMIRCGKNWRGS